MAITARIIDVDTGEIMASAKGDGTSKRSGLLLGGAGGGGGGGGGGVSFAASDFHDTILGEATEIAVKATTAKLVAAKSRLESSAPLRRSTQGFAALPADPWPVCLFYLSTLALDGRRKRP